MENERKKKVLIMQIGATVFAVFILVIWILNLKNVWQVDQKLAPADKSQEWLKIKADLSKTLSDVQNQLKQIDQNRKEQENIKNSNFLSDLVEETKKMASTTVVATTTAPIATSTSSSTASKLKRQGCPEWINCMPSVGAARPCQVPAGCEGITQIAY